MAAYITPKKSWIRLIVSFCVAGGTAVLLNMFLSGPRLGPWYDVLLRFRPAPPVSRDILLIEPGNLIPRAGNAVVPEDTIIEPAALTQAILTMTELDAAALVIQARVLGLSGDHRGDEGELLCQELESRFNVYNRLFRFDPADLLEPLQVRAYADGDAYEAYVTGRLGYSRPGAVYLHYQDPFKRELVIHRGSPGEDQIFPHQVFVQFLRAFIANPPAWMREGFALYFHTLRFAGAKEEGLVSYAENIAWLERVKKIGALPPVQAILRADIDGPPSQGELLSWALVSFLLNSDNEEYFRTLTECFMVLSPTDSAVLNAEAVIRRISLWTGFEALDRDFRGYIASQWTFADLVEDGQRAYGEKNFDRAKQAFLAAVDYKPAHYLPYYYLGLLAYEAKDYAGAEKYYRLALQYGADPAVTAYAWGISEISAGRTDKALGFLEVAASVAPDRYQERVNQLSSRLKK
jgi:hypothetical protein